MQGETRSQPRARRDFTRTPGLRAALAGARVLGARLTGTFLLGLALMLGWPVSASGAQPPLACGLIEVFHARGCPHCERALSFLDELATRHPSLAVQRHEVRESASARERFMDLNRTHGVTRPGVPSFLVCGAWRVGFDRPDTSGAAIEALILAGDAGKAPTDYRSDLFGDLSLAALGLPAFTLALGLIDGFNPCAMWVLVFLLSLLATLRDRRRMALIAGTFVLVSGAVYFAFMVAWLNAFLVIGWSRGLQVALGGIALLIAAVNARDGLGPGGAVSLHIPDPAKPGLYRRMRAVVTAEHTAGALVGVTLLAVLVNFIELLCTAGIPALYTQILSQQALSSLQRYAYIALYNVGYILDDGIMVAIAVITLSRARLQERHGRTLKLVSAVVIGALGIALIAFPGRLPGL